MKGQIFQDCENMLFDDGNLNKLVFGVVYREFLCVKLSGQNNYNMYSAQVTWRKYAFTISCNHLLLFTNMQFCHGNHSGGLKVCEVQASEL